MVVDASVALKWVVTEPGSEEAAALLVEMAEGTTTLVAPEHMVGEVGNGLRKRRLSRFPWKLVGLLRPPPLMGRLPRSLGTGAGNAYRTLGRAVRRVRRLIRRRGGCSLAVEADC